MKVGFSQPSLPSVDVDTLREIINLGNGLGFDVVGFSDLRVPETDRHFFLRWLEQGNGADMEWLSRDPERRFLPQKLLPEALGVISLGVRYFQGPLPSPPAVLAGRVARYAWGKDYHDVIWDRLKKFRDGLAPLFDQAPLTRFLVDAQPLLERAFARQSGLGFAGKNTNLIAPRQGSFIFLAEILINKTFPSVTNEFSGCGDCEKCLSFCPTGALPEPHRLDARLCIAYHTIENRGWIPRSLRGRLGQWIFGCDDCQDVCPFNAKVKETQWPEFQPDQGVGPWLPLREVLLLRSNEEFRQRFRGTPLLRAKRQGIVRNACIVVGNLKGQELEGEVSLCLLEDSDPVVRGHAAWALGRLGGRVVQKALEKAHQTENHPLILEEIRGALW